MTLLRPLASALLAATLLAPAALRAQAADVPPPNGPASIISANPFLPLFGYFQGEFERRVKHNVAVAISGSHVRLDDYYTNLDAKVRLYPNDRALEGFALAGSLGMGWLRRDEDSFVCVDLECVDPRRERAKRFATPSFAIEAHYQWLLGRTKQTAITVGFGAKRYLGGSQEDFRGLSRVLPTGRFSVGYGF